MSKIKGLMKSSAAIFVGIFANFLIAVPFDAVFHVTGVYPPMGGDMSDGLFMLAFSYRLLAAFIGGYLVARLAPFAPMRHAYILGGIGVLLSSIGAYVMWDLGHQWYPIALVLISIPCSWAGAKFYLRNN